MREIAVGCAELPSGMSRQVYFRKLRFLEVRFSGDVIPGERILKRWRTEAGGAGNYALIAPRDICDLKRAPATEPDRIARANELARAAAALGAAAVVFPTAPDVSPSAAHRDELRRFFHDIASPDRFASCVRVWQPEGLWRPAVAHKVAEELGVVPAQDPLAEDVLDEGPVPPPGEVAYARVFGLGRPARPYGEDDLARLADWFEPCRRGFAVFGSPAKRRDALNLAKWVGGAIESLQN